MDPMTPAQMKDWMALLAGWAAVGVFAYIIASTMRRKQRHEMQRHVLDKFASAKDFADFLQTPAGQKYVMSFADTATSAHSSILNSIRLGIVLLFAGEGLHLQNAVLAGMRVGMTIMLIGIGFLVSAAISYVLERKLKVNGEE